MRHNKSGRRLGRNSSHRSAMMRNMVTSLIMHEKITTTDARAKELRKIAEKMITLGKRGDLHARRQALAVMRERKAVAKLFDMVAPRYKDRAGGYTRIFKVGSRLGDNAPMAIVELVEEEFTSRPRKSAAAPAAPAVKAEEVVSEEAVAPQKGESEEEKA
ncbi:MAG: 50S ribosomal protein L17 [Desulfuromonadales bacterium]